MCETKQRAYGSDYATSPSVFPPEIRKEIKLELNPTHHQIFMKSLINQDKKSAHLEMGLFLHHPGGGTARGTVTKKDITKIIQYLSKVEKELL